MTKFKETKSTKCCGKCPFKRGQEATGESLGYSDPFVYIGQTRGPFWLPCHADKNYSGKNSNVETVSQCRGAAIFRANCETPHELPKELLSLDKDVETVEKEIENAIESSFLDAIMRYEISKKSETKRYI